jgi:hypothetical protein
LKQLLSRYLKFLLFPAHMHAYLGSFFLRMCFGFTFLYYKYICYNPTKISLHASTFSWLFTMLCLTKALMDFPSVFTLIKKETADFYGHEALILVLC